LCVTKTHKVSFCGFQVFASIKWCHFSVFLLFAQEEAKARFSIFIFQINFFSFSGFSRKNSLFSQKILISHQKFITKFLYFSFKLLKITSTIYPFQIHQTSMQTLFFKNIFQFSIKIFSIQIFFSKFFS
jgi:hypothetical protein